MRLRFRLVEDEGKLKTIYRAAIWSYWYPRVERLVYTSKEQALAGLTDAELLKAAIALHEKANPGCEWTVREQTAAETADGCIYVGSVTLLADGTVETERPPRRAAARPRMAPGEHTEQQWQRWARVLKLRREGLTLAAIGAQMQRVDGSGAAVSASQVAALLSHANWRLRRIEDDPTRYPAAMVALMLEAAAPRNDTDAKSTKSPEEQG